MSSHYDLVQKTINEENKMSEEIKLALYHRLTRLQVDLSMIALSDNTHREKMRDIARIVHEIQNIIRGLDLDNKDIQVSDIPF